MPEICELNSCIEKNDSPADKLLREAHVLGKGISQGFLGAANNRLLEHPAETSLEMTGLASLSYGLVKLASSNTPIRYLGYVVSAALGFSFVKSLSNDLPEKIQTTGNILNETWNSSANQDANAKQIGSAWGPFLFDTSLSMMVGLGAAKIAAAQIENQAFANQIQDKFSGAINRSVFRAVSEPLSQDGLRNIGTAFSVDKNRLATAFHVVENDPTGSWTLQNALSGNLKSNVLAGHPIYDLALFKVEGETKLNPLKLAQAFNEDQTFRGAVAGAANGDKVVIRPTQFYGGISALKSQYKTVEGIEDTRLLFLPALRSGKGAPGMSGGPSFSENSGEVVGVLSSVNYGLPRILSRGTNSIPTPYLRDFISMFDRAQQPGGSMTLAEASSEFGEAPGNLLTRLRSGKQAGFLIPSKQAEVGARTWEWRVMRHSP